MKTLSWKNIAIGILLLSNLSSGAYIFATQSKSDEPAASVKSLNDGNVRKAIVQAANLQQNSELQACYESFLRQSPRVEEGVVEMHWLLEKTGKISDLQMVRTEIEDQHFLECMKKTLSALTFRAPSNPTMVAHKFKFRKRTPGSVNFQ